jgi:hypothetical protein
LAAATAEAAAAASVARLLTSRTQSEYFEDLKVRSKQIALKKLFGLLYFLAAGSGYFCIFVSSHRQNIEKLKDGCMSANSKECSIITTSKESSSS